MYKNYSTLVFILFLLSLNLVKAQNTYVPDHNFEQALIDLGYDDVLDFYVLTSNISNITELNISSKNISNLIGIEDFENLQSLNCKNNQITFLHLNQNKQLKYLRCHYNKIGYLNLYDNSELEIINCRNNQIQNIYNIECSKLKELNCLNNNLTSLNLDQNSALTTLYCNSNQITDLNLSKNTELELLNCKSNRLIYLNVNNGANALITDFDATGNPDLECIIVDNAETANAGLSPYDIWAKEMTVTYCENDLKTYVPDDNFEQALIDLGYDDILDDYVITVNIADIFNLNISNQGIEDLTGIEGFISLKELFCQNNQLVSLDLTQNPNLTGLICSGNSLTNLNVTQNTDLDDLDCSGNSLTNLNVFQNTNLKGLICSGNPLTNLNITQNTGLNELWCQNTQLTSLDLSKNGSFEFVNCTDNPLLTSLNLKNGSNENYSEMHMFNNPFLDCIQVDDEDYVNSPEFRNIDTWAKDDHAIYANDCNNVGKTYVPDDNFEQALIDLGYDDVLDDYVLTANIFNIAELNVNSKNINDLAGIQDFENLQHLNCKNNQITSLDVSQNIQLQYLYCHYNQIQHLIIDGNPELEILNCRNNQIQELEINENSKLKFLNCLNNDLSDLNLSQNSALTTLYCNSNQITDLNLSKNKQLELLNCKKNELVSLNVNNGANALITDFDATDNPDLECIIVDNADNANAGLPPYNNWAKEMTTSYCENQEKTYVPDDNFEQALIDLGYDDVLDDYVLTSNISVIITLHIENSDTADLTGIEGFIRLEELWCRHNQLVSLDLSQNISLRELYCNYNQLTSLDLSKNVALWKLYCHENQLTSLNLKSGSNSLLKTMYAAKNPDLACIEVDDEDWANSYPDKFWVVDTHTIYANDCNYSEKTYVPDDNFEQALIDLGHDDVLDDYVLTSNILDITELDVDRQGIADLTGIEGFISLKELNCANNLLTNLNVRQNIALDHLDCQNNQLTSLDVSKNISLNELYCRDNQLSSLNLKSGSNTYLREMYASNNPDLACIDVDDEDWANSPQEDNYWYKDDHAIYANDCNNVGKTNIPDNNFEQALIDLGYDDVLDDYVLTANIFNIAELNVNSKNINDLAGIQGFKNLQSLICKDNQLTSLDVSQNIQLKYLKCHYNEIQSLHLSENPELEILNCRNNLLQDLHIDNNAKLKVLNCLNNNLTDLNISQNNVLKTLRCNSNQLTDLDLRNNSKLEILNCKKNQLDSLNVNNGANTLITYFDATGNPDLQCIIVDNAETANAGLAPYDNWDKQNTTSYCENQKTYVPDDNFEQALIDLGYDDVLDDYVFTSNISNIVQLDINNKNINDLAGIQDFKSLRSLSCYDNQITDLDMSKNIELRYLRCHDNQFTSLDLSNNKDLIRLSCRNNQITGLDLSQNTALTLLNCINNALVYLDVRNGSNSLLTTFTATGNSSLQCILLDNAANAIAGIAPYNNWNIDASATYSEACSYPAPAKTALNIEKEVLSDAIILYPNPVSGILNIDSGVLKINKVKVYTILGQKIKELNSNLNAIEMHGLASGVYLIRLYSKEGVSVRKIIKK